MNLKIDRKIFAQALSEVAPFAPAKPTIPILKFAKITTKGNRMKIEANDTQSSMVKYVPIQECNVDGTFLVEIADINKFVQKVKGETIEINTDGNTIKVKHSKGLAEFATHDAMEFPSFNMPDAESTEINISTSLLADAITKGKGFVASDTLRPILNAIYAYIKDGEFGYCATDTHKLIHGRDAYDLPDTTDIHWLIMPSVFSAITNACKGADLAKIQITDTHVQYTIGSVRIQTVQTKGNYPNFKRVIPSEWSMECAVDKSDLTEALGRVALFCDATGCVKIDVSRMDMTLSVDNLDYMKSTKENVTHNGCNGEIKIGVNSGFMSDCAGVFGGGEILLRMTDPARPIIFAQSDNKNLIALTMPLQLVNG